MIHDCVRGTPDTGKSTGDRDDCLNCLRADLKAATDAANQLHREALLDRKELGVLRAELQRVTTERDTLKQAGACDVCAGTGKILSGQLCMCGGTGRAEDAVVHLRERVCALELERNNIAARLAAAHPVGSNAHYVTVAQDVLAATPAESLAEIRAQTLEEAAREAERAVVMRLGMDQDTFVVGVREARLAIQNELRILATRLRAPAGGSPAHAGIGLDAEHEA